MKRKRPTLWVVYIVTTILILTLSMFVIAQIFNLLFTLGILKINEQSPLIAVILILTMSAISTLFLFMIVGRSVFKPFKEFQTGFKIVSKGDLDYRIPTKRGLYEIEEMRSQFNLMISELSSIETFRNDFIANVSHEFKTPLAAIDGYATLLQSRSLTQEHHDAYLEMIRLSVHDLSTLTGNILNLAKLENQEMVAESQTFRLDEQIRGVLALSEDAWQSKNLDMTIELERITYTGNRNLLTQVWQNIIDNAIKFSDEYGLLEVCLTETDAWIECSVKDSGIGIADADIIHIFDKFYQGDHSRSSSGNGLGLSLVKRILDLIGGSVTVESELNNGTHMTVHLPKEKAKR